MKILKLLSALIVLSFLSCDPKDDDLVISNNPKGDFSKNFGQTATSDFIGEVVDTYDLPVSGATVKIGNATVQTDNHGVFMINAAQVYEKFAYVTAEKGGYLKGSRALVPTSGKNHVKIMLLPATATHTVASGVSSTVALPNDTKIVFDGAFSDESGAAYSGTVSVSAFHLLPSDERIGSLMPGMLYAQSATGAAGALSTFGMLHVELSGSGGQKLQIASGHTAKITIKIDDTQLGTAPAIIPLWHFDEANGYWKEEGSATRLGNTYVGNVSHFSWWNYDAFATSVILTVTVVDGHGSPIPNVGIGLTVASTGFNSSVRLTDSNGQISGIIPSGQTLLLNAFDNFGNVIYTASIGPYISNATEQIVLTGAQLQSTIVKGSFTSCDNAAVENGYVLMYYGDKRLVSSLDNGNFDFVSLTTTNAAFFELEGIDFDNMQTTGKIAYQFSFPETKIEKLSACNTIQEFLFYQSNDGPVNVLVSPVQINAVTNGQNFSISTQYEPPGLFYLLGDMPSFNLGNYTMPTFRGQFWFPNQGMIYLRPEYVNTMVFHVNKFGAVGEYVDISFEGTYTDSDNVTCSLRGQAHVIRDN